VLHAVGVGDALTHGGSGAYVEDFYGLGLTQIEAAIRLAHGEDVTHFGPTQGGEDIRLTGGVAESVAERF
jgi:hypothetical protein